MRMPDMDKLCQIFRSERPKGITELIGCLGLTHYFSANNQGYAHYASTLTDK